MSPGSRLVGLYLAIQGSLGAFWWLAIWLVPKYRAPFVPSEFSERSLVWIAILDVPLFVLLSLFTSIAYFNRWKLSLLMLRALTVWVLIATGFCIVIHLRYGNYLVPLLMMTSCSTCMISIAGTIGNYPPEYPRMKFKEVNGASATSLLMNTGLQIVLFWSTLLLIVPAGLSYCESTIGTPTFTRLPITGCIAFGLSSYLNLWAAGAMVLHGRGTPLPTHTAPILVVHGPYKFVRNPMATFGLLQGVSVAVYLGSTWTILYVLIGGYLWNQTIRPVEEQDLLDRFGDSYRSYQKQVRCWIPRMS
jgi:protein-S-isoprenylcysteine O-methyltransferase Ste14